MHNSTNKFMSVSESKVKAKVNGTLDWLGSQPEQEGLISHAVTTAAKVSTVKKRRTRETQAEIIKRFVFQNICVNILKMNGNGQLFSQIVVLMIQFLCFLLQTQIEGHEAR